MKNILFAAAALMPAALMLLAVLGGLLPKPAIDRLWRSFLWLSTVAVVFALIAISAGAVSLPAAHPWLRASPLAVGLALLVQVLGTVIAAFSRRYLEGESGQQRYVTALAAVLAAVHLLLLADHWLVLIAAWTLVGVAMQTLLCFYPERPFALLAAHKKRIADRCADVMLLAAAALAWGEVGSGSLSGLWMHLAQQGMSMALQISAVCLVLAVILRTALLPVHGWLIQVMEAPTPVSALLHAGVVNLGGFVLIRFAPLLEDALAARALLLVFGLGTAVLAGMVMLTRISIKVRLAWSTVAQMGFMVLECALGLYTLAALHLIGHSLYKAHTFLAASTIVRQTRLQEMGGRALASSGSLVLAPFVAVALVGLSQSAFSFPAWPWWWSALLGLAWAPLLWLPRHASFRGAVMTGLFGVVMVAGLTVATWLAHALPLGIQDAPDPAFGAVALLGMAVLYVCLALLQQRPDALRGWRRWSYAGLYLDEVYTRLALKLWPARWNPHPVKRIAPQAPAALAVDARQ